MADFDFNAWLDRNGLTRKEAEHILGVRSRTIQNWAAGKTMPEPAVLAAEYWEAIQGLGKDETAKR